MEGSEEAGHLSDPSAHKSVYLLVSAARVTWIPLNPAALPHPCSTQGSLVRQTLPPTRSHSGHTLQVAGDVRTGCARACCPAHQTTPSGSSHHNTQHITPNHIDRPWDIGSPPPAGLRAPNSQARDLLHIPMDRADVPSTTDSVMTGVPHHQGKGLSPNHSAATARSLLVWLQCKAGINPGTVLEANRILKAGTHLSPQPMLFNSRAVTSCLLIFNPFLCLI